MKGKITKSIVLAMVTVFTFTWTVPAYAGCYDYCRKDGCGRKSGCNGTIYCDKHAAEYAREAGYKVCSVSGCYDQAESKGYYCSSHTCREKGCFNKSVTGSWGYCSMHDPSKKKASSQTATKKYSSKKSSSSSTKKKKDIYNVYDYDSAQAFADDKYEEFYDYEDDYEDEDEAYDAAVDYWNDHH